MSINILSFFLGALAALLLDLFRHITYFINWNYWQKRVWIKRHWKKTYDYDMDDDLARELAYQACNGPDIKID